MEQECAVRMQGITKSFGKGPVNDKITMEIRKGEILSLLGENGSGKTTLMNMLSGIYYPDEGQIFIGGEEAIIRDPKDAYDWGIGMVHQHFKLVDVFTAAENVALGLTSRGSFDRKGVSEKIREICSQYGFDVDPDQKVYNMSVSQKQTLEIVKTLYRGANILILDEPTAVLTPAETQKLFDVLRNMRAEGKSIVIITHKLHEVLSLADRVAVLRKGVYVGDVLTKDTDAAKLTAMMVGRDVSMNIDRPDPVDPQPRLKVEHLNCFSPDGLQMLKDVSFTAMSGEILGIAGISGSGQKELLEAIAGLQRVEEGGSITYIDPKTGENEAIIGKKPREIRDLGVVLSFVPEDRLGMGLVGSMDIAENMMLKTYDDNRGFFPDRRPAAKLAEDVIRELQVVTPKGSTPVRKLSGGNVQKVLLGRELSANPTVLMAAYAVRGLDVNTSLTIYRLLNEQKQSGAAVIYVGEDLDVLLELCDRILVLCSGQVSAMFDGRTATKEQVGYAMTYLQEGGAKDGE